MIFKSDKYKESCKMQFYHNWTRLDDARRMVKEINNSFSLAQYVTYMADKAEKAKRNYPSTKQGYTGYRACRNAYERLMSLDIDMEELNLVHIFVSDLDYLTQYENRETEAVRKTLVTIKGKGIYTTDIGKLIFKLPEHLRQFFSDLLLNQEDVRDYLKPEIFTLTDTDWLTSIELTAIRNDNYILEKAYLQTYWTIIKDNLNELYENVVLCHCINVFSDAIRAELLDKPSVFSSDDEEKLRKRLNSLQKTNEELKKKNADLRAKVKASIDPGVIDQQKENYEKKMSGFKRANAAQQAEINRLKKELERAESRIAELEKKAEEQEEPRIEAQVFEPVDLPELPETGVAFFGGHPNFTKKVEALHHDWKYYQDESGIGFNFGTGINLIIIRSEHISHSLFAKAMQLKDQIPVIYSSATNIDMLEDELKQEYAKVVGNVEDD